MIEQLKARWRRFTPEQRMAIGIGVPAAAGLALWQRFKSGGEPADDEAATIATTTEPAIIGTGADAGSLAGVTEAWGAGLADVQGQLGEVALTAQGAADTAAAAQAAAEAAQAAAEAASDSTGPAGGGGTTAGAGGRYGARYRNLVVQRQVLTARIAALTARIAVARGEARLTLRRQRQRLFERRRQITAELARIRAARRAGGPSDVTAMDYAPGVVAVGPSFGAPSLTFGGPVPSGAVTPRSTDRGRSLLARIGGF